MYITVNNYFGD